MDRNREKDQGKKEQTRKISKTPYTNYCDMDIRVGDRVSVCWDETNTYYHATVTAIHDMTWSFDVLYDDKVRGKPCQERKVPMDRVVRFGSPYPTHRERGSVEGEDMYVIDDGDEEEEELFRSFHVNEDEEDDGMYWGNGTVESAVAAAAMTTSGSGSKRKEVNILKYLSSLREEEDEEGKEMAVDVKLSVSSQASPSLSSNKVNHFPMYVLVLTSRSSIRIL